MPSGIDMLYCCIRRAVAVAEVEGRVSHLFVKPRHGAPMEGRPALHAVADQGLRGDAAFGTSRRQVLIIDSETLADFELAPGMVRENITVSGLSLQGLRRGTRLHFGETVLEITGDCTPCDYLDSLRLGLKQALNGRRGLLARVARGGQLEVGAPVRIDSADTVGEAASPT